MSASCRAIKAMMGAVILVDASKQFTASDKGIVKFRPPILPDKAKRERSSADLLEESIYYL